jgi:hypothetical protein
MAGLRRLSRKSRRMSLRAHAIYAGFLILLCLSACSPKATGIVGTWSYQENGMNWEWEFAADGSVTWKIVGQTDMGGKPIAIAGKGSYSLDGAVLLLKLDAFAGLPGILKSSSAAPGFDPSTEIALRFTGPGGMRWTFSTEALGKRDIKASRRK